MQQLTQAGKNLVSDIARRYNLSEDAVTHMLIAVNTGGGSMAQFNCYELGGSGQWMRGGMTMVGDMFNYGLKATVDNLCNELSNGLASMTVFPIIPAGTPGSAQWWPQNLGAPFSSGSQNGTRYAVFPQRLAIEVNGAVTVYDTLNHQVGGISQQQGGQDSLSFSSQFGTISVNSLPAVSGNPSQPANTNFLNSTPINSTQLSQPSQSNQPDNQSHQQNTTDGSTDVFVLIEKLSQLHSAGILSDDEFYAKKSELLSRL